MNRASLALVAVLTLPLACVDTPARSGSGDASKQAEADKGVEQAQPAKPEPAAPTGSLELSAEELELIASDSKTLTPEQNRKRAYALRKKALQNPESETAKALEEARAAALAGDLPPEQVGTPGAAKDPGMVIELPEHLQEPAKEPAK